MWESLTIWENLHKKYYSWTYNKTKRKKKCDNLGSWTVYVYYTLYSPILADNDIRCIFLAARALHDLTRTDTLIQVLLKKDQFWQKVLTALDKCNNDRVAKELARIIYDLTSKDGPQGREWCRILGVTADGLRVLIKMLEATVDHVVYCSVTSIHNIITKLELNILFIFMQLMSPNCYV